MYIFVLIYGLVFFMYSDPDLVKTEVAFQRLLCYPIRRQMEKCSQVEQKRLWIFLLFSTILN